MLKWGWYSDPAVKAVFIHLLLTAAFAPKEWKGVTLSAGQTVTSIKSLSGELGLSVKQVRTALQKLKKTGEISTKGANRFTIVTVENWELFQCPENFGANKGQTKGKQAANKGQQYKKYKNVKNNKNSSYEEQHVSYDIELFEEKARELPVYTGQRQKE